MIQPNAANQTSMIKEGKVNDMKKILMVLLTGLAASLSVPGFANPAGQPSKPAQPGEIYGIIGTNSAKSAKLKVRVVFGATPEMAREKVYNEFSGTPGNDVAIINEFKNACGAIAVPYGRDDYGWAVDKSCDLAVALAIKECSKKTGSECFRYMCSCSYGTTP